MSSSDTDSLPYFCCGESSDFARVASLPPGRGPFNALNPPGGEPFNVYPLTLLTLLEDEVGLGFGREKLWGVGWYWWVGAGDS